MDRSAIASPATTISERQALRFNFENTYAQLPERFYCRLDPTPVAAPRLVKVNVDLVQALGLDPDALASEQGVEILSGNRVAEGSQPLAIAYAGHQFGHFVPQLGDGRANLLGEVTARDGVRYDIQLKGSGPTPFSRGGDGRAALAPVLREYIVSEGMSALGVPTTRALAAVTTGERVLRERILPGAVLTRIAASHLRVGTFEYFAAQRDTEAIRILADYAIARHYPDAARAKNPYRALLDAVIARQAKLVAQWMLLGFVHGVMNTDNTSISGETIDYGPCAFMEAYDPATVFSSIDHRGRYAYGNQSRVALWNLTRLAEALLPVLVQEEGSEEPALASANEALAVFPGAFEVSRLAGMRRKLGLFMERDGDAALAQDLLERMTTNRADFTLTFRRLCDAAADPETTREYERYSPILAVLTRGLLHGARGWNWSLFRERSGLQRCARSIPHSSHETTWSRPRSVRLSSGRTFSHLKNYWMSCHAHTRTDQAWSGTACQPALKKALPRLSAGRNRCDHSGFHEVPIFGATSELGVTLPELEASFTI